MTKKPRPNTFVDWSIHLDQHDQPVVVCRSCECCMVKQMTQFRCSGCRQTVPLLVIEHCLRQTASA